MGSFTPTYPGPSGNNHNRCPVHPSEPLVGMCGCGTFFCRKCSASSVFCSSCHEKSRSLSRSGRQMTLAPAGFSSGHAVHAPIRPVSRRLLIEAVLTLVLATLALATVFTLQERSFAYSPNPLVSYGINAGKEPLQQSVYPFEDTIRYNGARATLSGDATYIVNARVQSTHAYGDEISVIMPYDFLLAWGDMADEDISSRFTWEQSDRRGEVSGTLGGAGGVDITSDYVVSHVSNSHLIPANEGIRQALAQVEPGDMVRIKGRLVDVRAYVSEGRVLTVSTSKSRTDQGDGACEVIFVETLRVNGESF